jgi:hypothetical protein
MRRSTTIPALLLLIALPAFANPQVSRAAFLGLAVANVVSEDENGLVALEGIHHSAHSEGFPYTEDLWVYTRWSGNGNHTVRVMLRDIKTDEVVAETEDELDFASDPVIYFTHDFISTTFSRAGAYAIDVILGEDQVAEYAFYVNADESYPDRPQLVLSVPAKEGSVDDEGFASVSGIFEYFTFSSFPVTDSFAVVTVWFSGEGNHRQQVQILAPDGGLIASSKTQTLETGPGRMSVLSDFFDSIRFPGAGTYTAALSLDGRKVFSFPLEILRK